MIIASHAAFGQSNIGPVPGEASSPGEAATAADQFEPLPQGYGAIELGMELETVKERLFADPNFAYRGEPDVTMLPQGEQELIDCEGALFVDRAFFQFEDGRLYLIIMMMDPEYIDHYSIYTALSSKYGLPSSLNPSKSVWEDERVIVSLERPLSLKYMDRKVFESLQSESASERTFESEMREDFINSF